MYNKTDLKLDLVFLTRTGMRVMVNELQATAPRPRSPHMNNEEPINLSHYPDGRKPDENDSKPRPIERDDFPGEIINVFKCVSSFFLFPFLLPSHSFSLSVFNSFFPFSLLGVIL